MLKNVRFLSMFYFKFLISTLHACIYHLRGFIQKDRIYFALHTVIDQNLWNKFVRHKTMMETTCLKEQIYNFVDIINVYKDANMTNFSFGLFTFSSPELKAQTSFSDHILPVSNLCLPVHPSVNSFTF